jgi:hypothetical protein
MGEYLPRVRHTPEWGVKAKVACDIDNVWAQQYLARDPVKITSFS